MNACYACLLLAAVSTRVELLNDLVRVPAGDWRFVEVALRQRPALVAADYRVESGGGEVRLALLRREQLDEVRPGSEMPEGALVVTPTGESGRMRFRVPERGAYVVLVDNRQGSRAVAAHLRIALDFGTRAEPEVTRLSPRRQFTVIAISFAVFLVIVTWSARRLLVGIRGRE